MGFLLCGRCRISHKSNSTPVATPSLEPVAHIETVATQRGVTVENTPPRQEESSEGICPPSPFSLSTFLTLKQGLYQQKTRIQHWDMKGIHQVAGRTEYVDACRPGSPWVCIRFPRKQTDSLGCHYFRYPSVQASIKALVPLGVFLGVC